jgi:Trk-type K+ transport system membrane component
MDNDFSNLVVHYSSDELLTMVYQFDQWEKEMMAAVQNELAARNLLPADISERRNKVIEREDEILSEGKEATFAQQFLGWIGVLGILGLIIGYELAFAKITSSFTDKEYFKYDEQSRESGRYMYYISLAVIILFFIYKIANFVERY